MNSRQSAILNELRFSKLKTAHLAEILGVPQPSVRRDVSALRAAGWKITHDGAYYSLDTTQDGTVVAQ